MEFGAPKKVLNSLEEISPETLESIAQWIENRGLKTPISQVVGYQQIKSNTTVFASNALVTTTSNSWTTTGLSAGTGVTNLRAGQYLVSITAALKISNALEAVALGIRINGADPFTSGVGAHGTSLVSVTVEGGAFGTVLSTVAILGPFTLTADTSTVVPVWFVSGGTGSVAQYAITLLRLGTSAGGSF